MRISQQKADLLNQALTELNKTVGTNMTTINNAVLKVNSIKPNNILLDYNDYTNLWYYTTLSGKELNQNFQIVK